ncbi:alpha/beta hydrolase family protein [Paractinoplanes atraurantiacus]|uniref:Platelet-activating factor acetylhydrolase, isoform II n=1 Tax=Paractinoplanes atraurantiacus TaxID=1036182 RepID=A0A285I7K1_9ACTN|nr:dienelactone hydrolase family protein [Actinoplanes atraurantiacus]SNY43046.1 Platelet-activating factor acetylhydrolase, isoform II [Actinoplanes atraurantiacus]
MSLWEFVVVVGSVALIASRWLPPRGRRPTALAALGVVVAGAALTLPAPRWQLLTVLAADVLVAAGWLLRRRASRRPALLGSLTCLALVAAGAGAAWALPVPEFPEPSGPSAVGTTVMQWTDPARAEPATPDPADRRTVVAQLWYPAQSVTADTPRAQYLGRTRREADTVAGAEAAYLGAPAFLLDGPTRAHSHAAFDATPAAGRFPVVLFSPGLGGVRTQNTAWAEDLASRGYVVAAVDHPYDSAAVVLADGRTVRTKVAATADAGEDARRRTGWIDVRAADLRFVLTQLGRLDKGDLAERSGTDLTGRLDTARAAATGHSIGGAAAMRAAERDPRFTAVINLDGGPDPDQGPSRQPVLALTHEIKEGADADYLALLSKILDGGSATSYRLTVPGSAHLTFTDAPLFLPPLPALTGSLGRTGSVRMTTETCAAFLDAVLRSRSEDLPAALSSHGDLVTY